MAGITGIGSGIDIDAIVKATVAAERAPKELQLSRQETSSTAKFTALGSLKSALNEFQAALKDLGKASLYGNNTATSSSGNTVTAKASSDAQIGKYEVKVESLSKGSRVTTAEVEKAFTSVAGALRVGLGPSDPDAIDVQIAQGQSLSQIRDTLNEALKGKGITVNLVNDAENSSRLVFSSTKGGAGNDIFVASDQSGLQGLAVDGSVSHDKSGTGAGSLQSATDAKFSIDGISMVSVSNEVSDAIPGVTLTLKAVTGKDDQPAAINVGSDKVGVTNSVKKFVESYNSLINTTNKLTSVTNVEGSTPLVGDLVGDSSVRALLNGLRSELGSLTGGFGSLKSLSGLGISTQKDGTLKVDDDKLSSVLTSSFEDVGGFFAGESGLMGRLNSRVSTFTQADGILDQRMKGQRAMLDSVKSQRAALELRVNSMQTRLYAQYNAMDSLVGQLTRTSDWMTGALESLPGVVKKG